MDIKSGSGYPSSALSNFAPRPFEFDGVKCNSFEGFIQSLKCSHEHIQVEICKLVGKAAKKKGKGYNWRKKQKLYWKGVEYDRESTEYFYLIERAYVAMTTQCQSFRDALIATDNNPLTHSIGKNKESETVLTEREFVKCLYNMRELAKQIENRRIKKN